MRQKPKDETVLALGTNWEPAIKLAWDAAVKKSHVRTELCGLYAAAAYDLAGVTIEELTEDLSYASRTIQDVVSRGRTLWAGLAAWPWWYFARFGGQDPPGRPFRGWRTDERMHLTFAAWESGIVPNYAATRRP